ncbi:MAG: hypothetical protein BWY19_01140 [bacterium ADurb.Bin212]|nr:MAG: hypothetical protein BWY19_01140 [bacterium ADurb.Bin212]
MNKKPNKIISVVTANYLEDLVLGLLAQAFEPYIKRDFKAKNFQVSYIEHTAATAGIVLAVMALEGFRNKIYYHKKIEPKNPVNDYTSILTKLNNNFPSTKFKNYLTELFIARDVVAHNHLYEVSYQYDDNYNVASCRQKLLKGYGDPKRKDKLLVKNNARKTRQLNLNLQPLKIGFEDLYTVLFFIDTTIAICQQQLGYGFIPFKPRHKVNGVYDENLSRILANYYYKIPNSSFKDRIQKLTLDLKNDYQEFIANNKFLINGFTAYSFDTHYVIDNHCPKCEIFGYHKPDGDYCKECGYSLSIGQS